MTAEFDYRAVVFDLDGTLVRLAVDWERVTEAVADTLEARGVAPPADLWSMLEAADRAGVRPAVESTIAAFERDGARQADRLPTADTVPETTAGVCSLNCEDACRIALSEHAIDGIATVVGRDTVATEKPDPEPLLETVRRLDADPADTVFVGDSDRDARTAERAGVDYLDVSAWLRAYA